MGSVLCGMCVFAFVRGHIRYYSTHERTTRTRPLKRNRRFGPRTYDMMITSAGRITNTLLYHMHVRVCSPARRALAHVSWLVPCLVSLLSSTYCSGAWLIGYRDMRGAGGWKDRTRADLPGTSTQSAPFASLRMLTQRGGPKKLEKQEKELDSQRAANSLPAALPLQRWHLS